MTLPTELSASARRPHLLRPFKSPIPGKDTQMTTAPPPAGATPHLFPPSSPEQCDHSPAAAIYAALTARPGGATTTIIADAAGIGRRAARDALAAMERVGAVARTKGGKPGVPEIWTSAIGIPHARTGQITQQPAAGPAGHGLHGPGRQGPAGALDDDAAPAADSGHHDGNGPATSDQVPGSGGPADTATPDPAVVTEIARRIAQILDAASAARITLAGSGNMSAVRAGLDEIWEQAAQARRALAAAAAARKAPAARPGALRDKILRHLRNHPGADFTPHEIHEVLGNSSGAIAKALDTLVGHGRAELACDAPRRFRLASGVGAPAQIGSADGTPAGTERAGAA